VDGKKLLGIVTTFDLIRILENPRMVKEFWGGLERKESPHSKLEAWSPFKV
jgi:hypothetical protein